MNHTHLEYFLTVYKYRNITLAANEIQISRQALSKIISEMEKELGKTLFTRTRKGMIPTATAVDLVPHAYTIIEEYNHILKKQTLDIIENNKVKLYVFDGFTEYLTPDFFTAFHEEFPNILLNFEEMTDTQVLDMLTLGQCDMAIVSDAVNYTAFKYTHLFHAQYSVLINKNNPLSQKEVIDFEDLQNQKIIGKNRKIKYYLRDVNYILAQDIKLNVIMETTTSALAKALVNKNMGIAFSWGPCVYEDCNNYPDIVERPLNAKGWGCDVFLIQRKDAVASPYEEAVYYFILDWISEKKKE